MELTSPDNGATLIASFRESSHCPYTATLVICIFTKKKHSRKSDADIYRRCGFSVSSFLGREHVLHCFAHSESLSTVLLLVLICTNKTVFTRKVEQGNTNKLNQVHILASAEILYLYICTLQKVWFHPLSPLLSVFQKWRQERPENKLVFVPHCM